MISKERYHAVLLKQFVKRIVNLNYAKENNIILKHNSDIRINNKFEGHSLVEHDSIISNSEIGYGTYFGSCCRFDRVNIGRYCSIGSNVKVIASMHPTYNWISTHPAFYSTRKQAGFSYVSEDKFQEYKFADDCHTAIIGNDVWIGDDVTIMGGVRINDGAIVGTGAVVTKDVEPYSIVAGIPAKEIRKRFSDSEINKLLELKWWDRSISWIEENAETFFEYKNKLAE